jgi:hypothetical protein
MLLELGVSSLFYEPLPVSKPEPFPVPRPMANATPKRFKGTIAIVTGNLTQPPQPLSSLRHRFQPPYAMSPTCSPHHRSQLSSHVVVVDKDVKAANRVSDEITAKGLGPAVASSIEVRTPVRQRPPVTAALEGAWCLRTRPGSGFRLGVQTSSAVPTGESRSKFCSECKRVSWLGLVSLVRSSKWGRV